MSERDASAQLTGPGADRDTGAQRCVIYLAEVRSSERLARNVEAGMVKDVNPV